MELNAKILVADENASTRHATKEALLRRGYQIVDEAQNGEEALIKINRNHPDIVICAKGLFRQAWKAKYRK